MKTSESTLREILKPAVVVGALWALRGLGETYAKDLDYIEPA